MKIGTNSIPRYHNNNNNDNDTTTTTDDQYQVHYEHKVSSSSSSPSSSTSSGSSNINDNNQGRKNMIDSYDTTNRNIRTSSSITTTATTTPCGTNSTTSISYNRTTTPPPTTTVVRQQEQKQQQQSCHRQQQQRQQQRMKNGVVRNFRTVVQPVREMLMVLLLFVLNCTTAVYGEEIFNTQIMGRITERLNEFLMVPVLQIHRLKEYRNLHGFNANMTSSDYKEIFTTLYTETKTAVLAGMPALLYYGLEDGTFFYITDTLIQSYYREPGQGGYNITNAKSNTSNPYYKFVNSCINSTTGESSQCTLQPKDKYIECINNCQLIPCPTNTSSVLQSSSSTSGSANNSNNTNNTVLWCPNYTVKDIEDGTVDPNSTTALGYIPRTISCINPFGQPEQRPGYVLKNITTNEMGTCYYDNDDDKAVTDPIIVNRTLTGRYAACRNLATAAQSADNSEDDITSLSKQPPVCSNVFVGGHTSRNYDPRYRGWYITTKQVQKDVWTAPYPFSGLNIIGITYSEPIYNVLSLEEQISTTQQPINDRIFNGVIAVDYHLQSISTFLIDKFGETDMKIIIVEQADPYYIIASSLPSSTITRMVLSNDTITPCPTSLLADSVQCTPIRIAIQELNIVNDDTDPTNYYDNNTVMYRAFEAQRMMNFPPDQQINFKVADIIGAPAYVGQGQPYSISNNLNWHVLVIVPMDRSTTDAALPGDPIFIVIILLGFFGFTGCFILFYQFYSKRTERAIIQADWIFTCAFLIGCTTLNLSTFTLVGENTNPICMLRMWSFNGLFVCALSPLFVKVWRMAKLLQSAGQNGFQRKQINNVQAFVYTLPLVGMELLLLTVFSIVDPPQQTELLGVGEGIGVQQVTCTTNTNAFFITQVVFDAILVFLGCVLAYHTRDLDPKFGEAKQLGFSMYNIAFTGIIILAIISLVDLDQVSQFTLQAVGVLWGSFFCSFAFVLPRLLEVSRDQRTYRMNTPTTMSAIATGAGHSINVNNNAQITNRFRKKSSMVSQLGDTRNQIHKLPVIDQQEAAMPTTDVVQGPTTNNSPIRNNNNHNNSSRISFPFTTWETIAQMSQEKPDDEMGVKESARTPPRTDENTSCSRDNNNPDGSSTEKNDSSTTPDELQNSIRIDKRETYTKSVGEAMGRLESSSHQNQSTCK